MEGEGKFCGGVGYLVKGGVGMWREMVGGDHIVEGKDSIVEGRGQFIAGSLKRREGTYYQI